MKPVDPSCWVAFLALVAWPPNLPAQAIFPPEAMAADEEPDLTDEFAFLEDAGMVESTSRHRQEIGMSPSAVTVLTREDVEASGATNLPDLLRLVPGMDVVLVSPSFYSIGSRLNWNNTNTSYQLLIDGRDGMNELMGQVPWLAEIISLEDVERIEIIRGPASSMYGASALAGVVSVTTRVVPEETSASVRFAGGEVGFVDVGARGSTRIGRWGLALSGGGDMANSLCDPRTEGRRVWRLRAVAEYHWSESDRFRIDAGLAQAAGSLNSSAGLVDMDLGLRTLRLAYDSTQLRGRFYWLNSATDFVLGSPLEYQGVRLATFAPATVDGHTVDGEIQWTLPELWVPLLLIIGGGGRIAWIGSDHLLDGDSYADITSSGYHQPGISQVEARGGVFVHAEVEPAEWVTVSGSLRFDYTTETGAFLSPRVATVFRPASTQFLRLGMSRAFRKPAFIENRLHPMLEFPEDSPVTGQGRQAFQEFMSKQLGNPDLANEEMLSFEVGYLGQFLERRLQISLDLFYNQLRNLIGMETRIVPGAQGLPDLNETYVVTQQAGMGTDVHGLELVIRFDPTKHIALTASWAYREVLDRDSGHVSSGTPKNLFSLGGRFRMPTGIFGSLYLFSRSRFTEGHVENPRGILAPLGSREMPSVLLIMGKLGWKWQAGEGIDLEAGAKLFLPISPFEDPLFSYYEDAGGVSAAGIRYGGEPLRRIVIGYVQGSY